MTVPEPLTGRRLARRTQAPGFSGLLFTETGRTAYLNSALACLQAARDWSCPPASRSPFRAARRHGGRGVGIAGSDRRQLPPRPGHPGPPARSSARYGAAFDRPGPRPREYVRAVKACFEAFRSGKLDHHGELLRPRLHHPAVSRDPSTSPTPKSCRSGQSMDAAHGGRGGNGVHVHPIGEPA